MDEASLIDPSPALFPAFQDMAREFSADGDNRYAMALTDADSFLAVLVRDAAGRDLPAGIVPQNTYWLVREGRVLGCSRLRHHLTPALERIGGHIGYDIRPSERRRGYGNLILAHTLKKARDLGLQRVLLTCDTANIASSRVIENNGGVLWDRFVDESRGALVSRYWIELPQ